MPLPKVLSRWRIRRILAPRVADAPPRVADAPPGVADAPPDAAVAEASRPQPAGGVAGSGLPGAGLRQRHARGRAGQPGPMNGGVHNEWQK